MCCDEKLFDYDVNIIYILDNLDKSNCSDDDNDDDIIYDSEIIIQNHDPELLSHDLEPDKIGHMRSTDFIAAHCIPEIILERVIVNDKLYYGIDTMTPRKSKDFNLNQVIENISSLQSTLNPYVG